MTAAAEIIAFVLRHWKLVMVALLGLLLVVQTERLEAAKARLEAYEAQTKQASLESAARGAQTGAEAVTNYVERVEENRAAVDDVAGRIAAECVRHEDRLPVPAGAGGSAQAAREAQDRRGRKAFARDLADDLKACAAELERLRALQEWVINNGG